MQRKIIVLVGLTISVMLLCGCNSNNCKSDNEKFTKIGVVKDVTYLGGSILIDFINGSYLYIHGSSNNKYPIEDLDDILVVGAKYRFSYHYECVMSDGNEPVWFEGNVIDKLEVYQ